MIKTSLPAQTLAREIQMNIRQQLLREHSRRNADAIESQVVDNEGRLVELMACFFSDEVKVAQRAAMVVGNLGRHHPKLLKPWWRDLVAAADRPLHQAIRRSVTRYFSELPMPLPKKMEANLIELCSQFVEDPCEKTATAVFSMQFVADRVQRYPDQAKRLRRNLNKLIPNNTPGFQSRGERVLRQLEKSQKNQ